VRVLVTGAFGYIGGRVAQHLSTETGTEVLLGTRRQTDLAAWLPHSDVVRTPWDSAAGLDTACSGIDVIVHTAGMNAQDCVVDPVAALEFNGGATARLVEAANRQGVGRLIYISTAHVYCSPLTGTITEQMCPTSPHPYATSHRAGEDAVLWSPKRGGTEGCVLRLSNAYGPPAHAGADCWTLLVNDLCRQAVTEGCLALRSSGLQRRDFVPLSEVCRAVRYLVDQPLGDGAHGLLNVGCEWAPTVWEMTSLIQDRCEAVLGYRPEASRVQPAPDEPTGELTYRLDALRRTGFSVGESRVSEIDHLLGFSRVSFGLADV
jgi:UDP-glucose 4-epimerase